MPDSQLIDGIPERSIGDFNLERGRLATIASWRVGADGEFGPMPEPAYERGGNTVPVRCTTRPKIVFPTMLAFAAFVGRKYDTIKHYMARDGFYEHKGLVYVRDE